MHFQSKKSTLKDLIDCYLIEIIEDRVIVDQRAGLKKKIEGSRN